MKKLSDLMSIELQSGMRIVNRNTEDVPARPIPVHTTASPTTQDTYRAGGGSHMHTVDCAEIYRNLRQHLQILIRSTVAEIRGILPFRVTPQSDTLRYYKEQYPCTVGTLGGQEVYLYFKPRPDITPYELYLCQKALGPLLRGNVVQFIIEHELLRHWQQVGQKPGRYIEERIEVQEPCAMLVVDNEGE